MAVTFGTPSLATSATSFVDDSITVSAPADLADGCYVVVLATASRASSTTADLSGPSGFTRISAADSALTNIRCAGWVKSVPAAASEPADYTVSGFTSASYSAVAFAVFAADESTAIEAVSSQTISTNTTGDISAISVSQADGKYVAVVGYRSGFDKAINSTPASFNLLQQANTSFHSNGQYFSVYEYTIDGSGTEGPHTIGFNQSTTFSMFGFAIAPEAGSVPAGTITPGTTTNIGPDSATLNWTYNDTDQDGFKVRVREGTPIDVGDVTSYNLTGLTRADSFALGDVEILAYNADGDQAAWTDFAAFDLSVAPIIDSSEIFDQDTTSLRCRTTTDTDNGTVYFALYSTSGAAAAATDAEIKAESTSLTDAVAAASVAVSATGVISTSAITGLTENTTYYAAAVHEGDYTQNA